MNQRPLLSMSFLRKHAYELGLAAALTAIGLAAIVLAGGEAEGPKTYTKAGVSAPTPR